MIPHPRARHVLCRVTPRRDGVRIIQCQCRVCGDQLVWPCQRGPEMAQWRVEQYVNMHLHGTSRPVYFPMPR